MSDVQIIKCEIDKDGNASIEASCGKKSASVWFSSTSGSICVCCKNAAHAVYRGMGRSFFSMSDALAGYKSAEMKANISAAARAQLEGKAL